MKDPGPKYQPGMLADLNQEKIAPLLDRHGIPAQLDLSQRTWPEVAGWIEDVATACVLETVLVLPPKETCHRCGFPIQPGEAKETFRAGEAKSVRHLSCPVATKEKP